MGMREEFAVKIGRVRHMLEEEQLWGCYMKRQDNFAWLTCGGINYVMSGDLGNCGLLVTESKLYAITNNVEGPRMRDEEKLEELGFELLAGVWYDGGFEAETLEHLCGGEPVGFDQPGRDRDLTGRLKQLRASLTPEETDRYMEGGRHVSRLMEETAASVRSGETERAVAARAAAKAISEGFEPLSIFCSSDERIQNYRHAITTGKVIQRRVQLGCNIRYKGLVIGCTRFVSLEPADEAFRRQYRDNTEIGCRMIAATRPGVSCQEPLLAGKAAYQELGYNGEFSKHHQGGSIGYQARDCRVDFTCNEIIAENQAFCWNPSITGTKSEDTIITSGSGIRFVTAPCLYPVLELEVDGMTFRRAGILEKY